MEKIAALSNDERRELFSETASRMNVNPAITEKDFWVCWALKRIFEDRWLSEQLVFKGGTSLSKVFNLIERFSEDIDLILDWRTVTGKDPMASVSKTKQQALNAEINTEAETYIAEKLCPRLQELFSPVCTCSSNESDPNILNVEYPAAFSDEYLRPAILLEIGPLAAWLPHEKFAVTPYAAQEFPKLFEHKQCLVSTILAERTFWEKMTILHQEAHRPEGKTIPTRYSRHYYDAYMMINSVVKGRALADIDMLVKVADFKRQFYPRAWAKYDLAKPGSLRLVPEAHVLKALRSDYVNMRNMIFGAYPTFDEIIASLSAFEEEVNSISYNS